MSRWGRGCSAPACRCMSPCDEYYGEEPEPEPEWVDCEHCAREAYLENAEDHEKICQHCGRGAEIASLRTVTRHRARKEHHGLYDVAWRTEPVTIYPGDIYERRVTAGYEVGGARWLSVRKVLVRRATELEKLAALKHEKEDEKCTTCTGS